MHNQQDKAFIRIRDAEYSNCSGRRQAVGRVWWRSTNGPRFGGVDPVGPALQARAWQAAKRRSERTFQSVRPVAFTELRRSAGNGCRWPVAHKRNILAASPETYGLCKGELPHALLPPVQHRIPGGYRELRCMRHAVASRPASDPTF